MAFMEEREINALESGSDPEIRVGRSLAAGRACLGILLSFCLVWRWR